MVGLLGVRVNVRFVAEGVCVHDLQEGSREHWTACTALAFADAHR